MLEDAWQDNEYTIEGKMHHERVHTQGQIKRGDTVLLYDFNVHSHLLRIRGKCDCIEATHDNNGSIFPFSNGRFTLYPVEYKHGVIRNEEAYNLQLCAQAMCLEEMYHCKITKGAVFYINSHRRIEVVFSDALRRKVISMAKELYEIFNAMKIPPAVFSAKCKKCSLLDICLPKLKISAKGYNDRLRKAAKGECE